MRRSVFVLLLLLLAGFAIYRYTQITHGGGSRRGAEKYTPASGPKIDPKDVQVLAALDAEYSRLVAAVIPSVVSVTSQRLVQMAPQMDLFEFLFRQRQQRAPQPRVQTSLGSGVIVSREGHILTNHHVIKDMNEIKVQLTDGRIEPATLIGSDELSDIAVLKIEGRNLEPLPLGDSDEVRVGQMVFAVGNPFGLSESVTTGIVSAKGRRAMADSGVEFFQTDAAVNQGNSGGPLINLRGEIVGINTAIYSETGGWLGISFAVPSNVARRALDSLLRTGRIVRGYLGVVMQNLTPALARGLGTRDTTGVIVTEVVPDSPAARAGMQRGDIVRTFNGREVADILALRSRVAETEIGGRATIVVSRAGEEVTLTAEIGEAPAGAR
jgi:serine protease Do